MGSASPLLIVGAALIGLGEILHIVGLATNSWIEGDDPVEINSGLWEYCLSSTCVDVEDAGVLWDEIDSDIEATRAMVIIGMLFGLAGLVIAVLKLVSDFIDKTLPKLVPAACLGSTIAAFVFIIIGVIIYGVNVYDEHAKDISDLGYSFALCIVGGILMPVGGALVLVGGGGIGL